MTSTHGGSVRTSSTCSEDEKVDRLVAQVALEHYEAGFVSSTASSKRATLRGKPNPETEWTVYSALVAVRHRTNKLDPDRLHPKQCDEGSKDIEDAFVVSCATGTKCTTSRKDGFILHDCHGEVLVRRGLVVTLLREIQRHGSARDSDRKHGASNLPNSTTGSPSNSRSLLEPIEEEEFPGSHHKRTQRSHRQFRLRSDTTLHLYISDSPCGDASIYELSDPTPSSSEPEEKSDGAAPVPSLRAGVAQFTGSKLVISSGGVTTTENTAEGGNSPVLQVLSSCATGSLLVRETGSRQLVGRLRSKSSRSNVAHRSSSHSCSDKICRWQILGWQGCAVLPLIPDPIRAASIVVSRDPRAAITPSLADDTTSVPGVLRCDQEASLQRAIVDRVQVTMKWLRSISEGSSATTDSEHSYLRRLCRDDHLRASVVKEAFTSGKSQMLWKQVVEMSSTTPTPAFDAAGPDASAALSNRKRKRAEAASRNNYTTKLSPCGFSLNWNVSMGHDALPEVLVGSRGIRQGKVPRCDADHRALASQLCRARLAALTTEVLQASRMIPPQAGEETELLTSAPLRYRDFKAASAPPGYKNVRHQLFSDGASPLAGWLVDEQEGDFALSHQDT